MTCIQSAYRLLNVFQGEKVSESQHPVKIQCQLQKLYYEESLFGLSVSCKCYTLLDDDCNTLNQGNNKKESLIVKPSNIIEHDK